MSWRNPGRSGDGRVFFLVYSACLVGWIGIISNLVPLHVPSTEYHPSLSGCSGWRDIAETWKLKGVAKSIVGKIFVGCKPLVVPFVR